MLKPRLPTLDRKQLTKLKSLICKAEVSEETKKVLLYLIGKSEGFTQALCLPLRQWPNEQAHKIMDEVCIIEAEKGEVQINEKLKKMKTAMRFITSCSTAQGCPTVWITWRMLGYGMQDELYKFKTLDIAPAVTTKIDLTPYL